ncbi:hypothetical protein [Geodermatophilus sabuli]|uniref:Uncharacterized protein n=1 Tax=Geodermatophilus sabuli TaxID=1564158 RepID=A0A285E7F3_9ACTN|nr:hypothetical protein [Geodermatophilus sabuli]MBB3082070.1 hypothetical protein [Geodermatophilus sabuli]SNX95058.1 hypothetical protein SAMN06893097_101861 [Geodermatophilus sabuli]
MILAAGLLVLIGLGMFVGGLVTDITALYWVCVVACALAAVLLVLSRVAAARDVDEPTDRAPSPPAVRGPSSGGQRADGGPATGGQRAVGGPDSGGHRAAGGTSSDGHRAVHGPSSGGHRALRDDHHSRDVPAGESREPAVAPELPAWPVAPPGAPTRGPAADAPTGAHAAVPGGVRGAPDDGEPAEEDVEVTDLLLVVDLDDEVLVVDEHPRYHVAVCPHLSGATTIPLPMAEARADGFTPCGTCRPVRQLADTERARRRSARGY